MNPRDFNRDEADPRPLPGPNRQASPVSYEIFEVMVHTSYRLRFVAFTVSVLSRRA